MSPVAIPHLTRRRNAANCGKVRIVSIGLKSHETWYSEEDAAGGLNDGIPFEAGIILCQIGGGASYSRKRRQVQRHNRDDMTGIVIERHGRIDRYCGRVDNA